MFVKLDHSVQPVPWNERHVNYFQFNFVL